MNDEELRNNEFDIDEEGTESEDDLGKQNIEIYAKSVLWGTDWTSETIINQLRKKNIELNPDFQRRDAWDLEKKSKFIESLILGLPVPPIILAESKIKKGSYIVIDGKQRLLTIMQFCAPEGEQEYDRLFLKGLKILEDLNGKNYALLDTITSNNDFKTQFDNQTIRTVVLKNWPSEKFLYTVFLRLNTGSLKLSPQELRQALHPGEFLKCVNDYTITSETIRKILKLKKPDTRMRDVELLIRFFAFKNFLNDYKGSLKDFLDDSCKKINNDWNDNKSKYLSQLEWFEKSIDFVTKIFGERARFTKFINGNYTNIFNRVIFDIMVYYFSDEKIYNKLLGKESLIKQEFEKLMTKDKDFIEASLASTKDLDKTKLRYKKWNDIIQNLMST
jgi:hypothetical protein